MQNLSELINLMSSYSEEFSDWVEKQNIPLIETALELIGQKIQNNADVETISVNNYEEFHKKCCAISLTSDEVASLEAHEKALETFISNESISKTPEQMDELSQFLEFFKQFNNGKSLEYLYDFNQKTIAEKENQPTASSSAAIPQSKKRESMSQLEPLHKVTSDKNPLPFSTLHRRESMLHLEPLYPVQKVVNLRRQFSLTQRPSQQTLELSF